MRTYPDLFLVVNKGDRLTYVAVLESGGRHKELREQYMGVQSDEVKSCTIRAESFETDILHVQGCLPTAD